jgi:hypothetical protein
MPTVQSGFTPATFLPEVADFSAVENREPPGTPIGVEHYVGRAGPDPGYVNLPPSTVGIGGPLISPKKGIQTATRDILWLRLKAGRP